MPLVVTRRFASWAKSGGKALRSIAIFAGRCPPIVLSIPSIYLLIFYPPLWKDIDAVCQLIFPADDMNILHFPPIYCFLGRIPFLIAGRVAEHGSHNSLPPLFGPQQPSLAGIYLLVVTQHLALIAALTYTVVSLTEDRVLRGLFAFVLASCSSFYTYAQCCGSEALSIIATFAVMGAGISIVRRLGLVHWYVYGAALFLAIGSRHLNLLFSIWLPLTLIVRNLARRFGWCDSEARNADWKTTGVAALVGVFAIGSNLCIARYMISAVHDEYRSTLGRTLSDRIGRFLDELPQGARLRLAQELSVKTPDPLVKMAVESQAITGTFYNGTGQKITDDLVRSGVSSEKIGAQRDRIILAATMRYLMTLHPTLIRVIFHDVVTGFTTNNPSVAMSPFYSNAWGAADMARQPKLWEALRRLPFLNLREATTVLNTARRDPYINFGGVARVWVLVLLTLSFGVVACVLSKRIPELVLAGWCALLTGIVLYVVNVACVYFMPRYALPLLTTTTIALLASVAGFCPQPYAMTGVPIQNLKPDY